MKLPGVQYGGVQSLGQQDVGGPARLWAAKTNAAQAKAGAIGSFAGAVGKVAEAVTTMKKAEMEEQARQRSLKIQKRLQEDYDVITNKPAWDLGNPDDALYLEGTTYNKSDGAGNERTTIGNHEVMQQTWENRRNKIVQDGMADMTPEQQQYINKQLDQFLFTRDSNIHVNQLKATNDYMRNTAVTSAQAIVDSGDLPKALVEIEKSVPFTQEEKDKLKIDMTKRHERNQLEGAMFAKDVGQQALQMADYLESDNYVGHMTPEERDIWAGRLRRQADEKRADIIAAEEKQHAKYVSDMEIGIVRGQVTDLNVEDAYNDGKLNEAERTRFTKMALQQQESRIKGNQNIAMGAALADGTALAKPYNSDHRKAIDAYVDSLDPRQEGYIETLQNTAVQTGYIPQQLQDIIEGGIINGDQQLREYALQTYSTLSEQSPHLVNTINENAKETLSAASFYYRTGVPASAAIKQAEELINVKPEVKAQRKAEFTELRKKTDAAESLKKKMDEDEKIFNLDTFGWGADVSTTSRMTGEYARLTENYYTMTGDFALAESMAYDNMTRTWGMTTVGAYSVGGEVKPHHQRAMKYPVERTLNISTEDANMAIYGYAKFYQLDPANITLMSDDTTAKDMDSWKVMVYDSETGFPQHADVVTNDRSAARISPMDWIAAGREEVFREVVTEKLPEMIDEFVTDEQKKQFRKTLEEQKKARNPQEDKSRWEESDVMFGAGKYPRSPYAGVGK
jgi:hypothetical protein